MHATISSLAVWLALWVAPADVSCLRMAQPGQRWLLDLSMKRSATFAALVRALCQTNVIAYAELSLTMPRSKAGSCQLVVSTPTTRFVRIKLNALQLSGVDLIAVFSHELEHAVQIGRATWVRYPRDVLMLQRFISPQLAHSAEAERVEAQARREVLASLRAPRDATGQ